MGNNPHSLKARPRKPTVRSRECFDLLLEHAPGTPGHGVSRDLIPGRQHTWLKELSLYLFEVKRLKFLGQISRSAFATHSNY